MEGNKILMQSLYKDIILEFSKETDKGLDESIDLFYTSETYELITWCFFTFRKICCRYKFYEISQW
jgi:hypothetical protein